MSEKITCPRCGEYNPADATTCYECHGLLGQASPRGEGQAMRQMEVARGGKQRGASGLLARLGVLGVLGAAGWVVLNMTIMSDLDLSAVQVTQLYTQGIFWVLVVIGMLLVGILRVVSTRE